MNEQEQLELTQELVKDISQSLKVYLMRLGVPAIPKFTIKKVTRGIGNLTVGEMVKAIDTTIDLKKYPQGLKSKKRQRYIVMRRQIVCYLGRKLNYTQEEIGIDLDIDHATVIHACRLVSDLLEAKDGEMTRTYHLMILIIKNYYKEKYGEDLPETSF